MSLRMPVGGEEGEGVKVVLTRQQLEKLSAPLFKRMGKAVDEACWQVRCNAADHGGLGRDIFLCNVSVVLHGHVNDELYGLLSSDGT